MKDFNIDEFNNAMEMGEQFALVYIKNTIIKNIYLDLLKYSIKDYIVNLYSTVDYMYQCVVATERAKDNDVINRFDYTFDKYTELRDMLFNELGIEYKNYKYILKNRKILKKLEEVN